MRGEEKILMCMCPCACVTKTRPHGFRNMCQENRAMLVAVCSSSSRLVKGHDDYLDFMRSSHIHAQFRSVLHAEVSQGKGKIKKKPTPGRGKCVSCMSERD